MDQDLRCIDVARQLTDYLEGALDEEATVAVELHLALCRGCARHLDQLQRTIEAAGSIAVEELPEELVDDLCAAFRALQR